MLLQFPFKTLVIFDTYVIAQGKSLVRKRLCPEFFLDWALQITKSSAVNDSQPPRTCSCLKLEKFKVVHLFRTSGICTIVSRSTWIIQILYCFWECRPIFYGMRMCLIGVNFQENKNAMTNYQRWFLWPLWIQVSKIKYFSFVTVTKYQIMLLLFFRLISSEFNFGLVAATSFCFILCSEKYCFIFSSYTMLHIAKCKKNY